MHPLDRLYETLMDVAFDPRSFITVRADLSSRLGAPVTALAILDGESNVAALDSGMASLIDESPETAIGRGQKWLFGKLGIAKKMEASELMSSPQRLSNGQEATMSLTAEGLALCVVGEASERPLTAADRAFPPTEVPEKAAASPVSKTQSVDVTDLTVSLGACAGIDDFKVVIETLAPRLLPGSTGCVSLVHGSQALVVAAWGGSERPVSFDSNSCVAMRLGRIFPSADERVPLQCKHGSELCVPVFSGGAIVALVSLSGKFSREAGIQMAEAVRPHVRLLS